ncbi:MAG: hypothetical protein ACK4NF_04170 [Planctomycetota bacterium]
MKNISLLSVLWLMLVAFYCKCEWQWTKETGWINIKKIRLGESAKLNKDGMKLLKEGRCNEATEYFIGAYRTAKTAKFTQVVMLNLARAWICVKKYYRAYSVLKLLTTKYPYSPYLEEIIKLNYEIGFSFLKGAKKEIWGVSILPAKSIGHNLIQTLIDKYPFSKYTRENILKYANFSYSKKKYSLAYQYYKKYIELYPEDEYSSFAVIRMFQSKENETPEGSYDKTSIEHLESELRRLYLDSSRKKMLTDKEYKQVKRKVDELKAKADFDVAMYYLKVGKKEAAQIYLESIVDEYPDSTYARKAIEELKKINNKN